jgi:hypothetical protein
MEEKAMGELLIDILKTWIGYGFWWAYYYYFAYRHPNSENIRREYPPGPVIAVLVVLGSQLAIATLMAPRLESIRFCYRHFSDIMAGVLYVAPLIVLALWMLIPDLRHIPDRHSD